MTKILALWRCERAAGAAEFALVLPLLLLFLFGIIDGGRYLWAYNQAEKATQVGARYAAVTNMIVDGFADYSFATEDGVDQGTVVPTANFDTLVCDDDSCTCSPGGGICSVVEYNAANFDAIIARMDDILPGLTAQNVTITYRNVGLGFSGDPNGPDVAPMVTVALNGMNFQPITTLVFGVTMSLNTEASLTAEDLSGNFSN